MNFEEIKDKIYPWIKVVYEPDEEVPNSTREIKLKDEEQPIMQNWLGNLAIFYAVDEGDQFSLVLKRDLPTKVSIEELHEIATTNLDKDVEFTFNETGFGGHGLIAGGDHEAGSLTLTGIWEWCADQIQDNLIVAVPAKDLIMMVPENDKDKINSLKDFVTEIFKDGERLLTKQLYRFDKSNYEWTQWGQVD
ncbi:MAG: DUF1444 family protein [Weeksellaceae bacterium]